MSNYTPATATIITALPYTATQTGVQSAPTGSGYTATCFTDQFHAVWWRYSTGPADIVLALAAVREVGHHSLPTLALYTGTPGALTQYQLAGSTFCGSSVSGGAESLYFKIPVAPNTTYYIQVTDANNATDPTTITLHLLASPQVRQLRNAVLCTTNGATEAQVFNSNLQSLGVVDFGTNNIVAIITSTPNSVSGNFYVITEDYVVTLIGPTGTMGQQWALPAFDPSNGIVAAVDRAGDVLYYLEQASNPGGDILRYSLRDSAPMTILTAGFGSESVVAHGYVDAEGDILFPFRDAGDAASRVRRFNTAGIVVDTYTTGIPDVLLRICFADDAPGSFWAWGQTTGTVSPSTMVRIRLSDGAAIATLSVPLNTTSEIGVVSAETFPVSYYGWFLHANEGLLISDNSAGFPSAVVNDTTGARAGFFALSPLSTTDIYSVIEAAIMAPTRAAVPVIPDPTQQWRLHRLDAKQRREQTA